MAIQELRLSHNNISGPLPGDMLNSFNTIVKLDLSFNQLTGSLQGTPPSNMQKLALNGNPELVGELPTWVTTTNHWARANDEPFQCPTLSVSNGLELSLDAAYYNYLTCTCLVTFHSFFTNHHM
jgi:hypothetical protein